MRMRWDRPNIHEALKSARCVAQPEWQHREFKETISGQKCSLVDVTFCYCDLVITSAQVNFAKEPCMRQTVKQIINAGQWICIPHGSLIQHSVVNAHEHATVLFSNENYRCPPTAAAGADPPLAKV